MLHVVKVDCRGGKKKKNQHTKILLHTPVGPPNKDPTDALVASFRRRVTKTNTTYKTHKPPPGTHTQLFWAFGTTTLVPAIFIHSTDRSGLIPF